MISLRSALAVLLVAAVARRSRGQTVQSLPQCGQQCINNELGNPGLGCGASSTDLGCLCANPNFGFGVRDCAIAACGPLVAITVTSAANALCATATLPPKEVALPTSPNPAPTSPASPSRKPSTTSASPVRQASTSLPVASFILAPSATHATLSPQHTSSSKSSPTSSPTTSAVSSKPTGGSPATTTTSNAGTADNSNGDASAASHLSTSVKAGIAIGASAAALALIGVALFAIARRRRNRNAGDRNSGLPMDYGPPPPPPYRGSEKPRPQISDPLQGSGRSYANDAHYHQYVTGRTELEQMSRRYEDMVPRVSPKHMV